MSGNGARAGLGVVLVAASNRRRGAEVFTYQLRRGLLDKGWDVDAVALTDSHDAATVEITTLTELHPESVGRFDRRIAAALRAHVAQVSPDLVVAMGGPTLRYAVGARLECPIVYFAIGEPRYWLRSRTASILNRLLLAKVQHVIAVSEMTSRQLQEMNPGLVGRVSVARTGVDDSFFEVESIPGIGPRAVFVGSLSPEKDPGLALDAVGRAPDWELSLVGAGPLHDEIATAIGVRSLGDRVSLVGAVDDVRPHLARADLLLLTSRTEGLPGVVLEAAAAGVPSLAVDVGGLREAVVDGVTGLVVRRDRQSLTEALVVLGGDPVRLTTMGEAARARANEEFRLADSVDHFASVLVEVAR